MLSPLLLCVSLLLDDCNSAYERWPETNVLAYVGCANIASAGDCIVADAGTDFTSPPGPSVMLDGSATSATSHPELIQYSWIQVDNGAPTVTLIDADTATPHFEAQLQGKYQFQLTASWNCREDLATVSVTIGTRPIPSALNTTVLVEMSCQPVQLTYAFPGDTRMFIVTKPGVISIYKNGSLLPTPFLDIQSLVTGTCAGGTEQGLLGMAFDPDYQNNGIFYINYTGTFPSAGGSANDTRIVAYGTSGNPDVADAASATLLLTVSQPETNHNGGQILFGPDDYLYIGTGDGGGGGDIHGAIGNGQNRQTLLGKMLRYEANQLDPLSIPPSNPFVGDPSTFDDIYALGLRNPWRFSFDRLTGDLYIGDVGQGSWEEIDFQEAGTAGGQNYGWRLMEGTHCYNPATNCDPGGLTYPIHDYDSGAGNCSVIGGYVYRGSAIPDLDGFYIYSDYCGSASTSIDNYGTLINFDGNWIASGLNIYTNNTIVRDIMVAFGEDSAGELYTLHFDGTIRRITGVRSFHP